MVDFKDEKISNFFQKIKVEILELQQKLKMAILEGNYTYITLYTYKMQFFIELYELFKSNRMCELGHYIRLYGDLDKPLSNIYSDYISNFKEPKLLTDNKLFKLLDKKGV